MDTLSMYQRIIKLLEQKGISGNKMLTECGINKSFLNDMKKKGTIPSVEIILKISDYFNVSTDYLLRGSSATLSDMEVLDGETQELFKNYFLLDSRGKTMVRATAYRELDRIEESKK